MSSKLLQNIESRSAIIGVIGLGYVGLPLAIGFGKIGYSVVGIDLSVDKVQQVNEGISYIPDVSSDDISQLVRLNKLTAFTEYEALVKADVIFICVPTPFDAQKAPDLSFIKEAAKSIAYILHPDQMVILQSTTYPGTTAECVLPLLEESGLVVGKDFYLAFSPERIDPGHVGSAGFNVQNTPKVVGGVTQTCTQLASALLKKLTPEVHSVSSPSVAEMSKLLENIFRSVNIALVNELTLLSDRMGIDIWEVIEAAKTKPFGFMAFYPGPGVGGHCIPVDPYYLSWKARELDFYTKFIELAAEINSRMPYFVVEKITQALNQHAKSLHGANVLVLGVAFKRDIDDARNSPAERVIELLIQSGANVKYHDPYVSSFKVGGNAFLRDSVSIGWAELTSENLSCADCVVVLTGHSSLDYGWVVGHSQLLVDTVNVTGEIINKENVVRLGSPFANLETRSKTSRMKINL